MYYKTAYTFISLIQRKKINQGIPLNQRKFYLII